VKGQPVIVGPPSIHPLEPAEVLDARLVAIKLTKGAKPNNQPFDNDEFANRFLAEAQRQIDRIGVTGTIDLRGRASFEVGGRRVIGYSVRVGRLSQEHSIALQIAGIGGKRTMGCGLFRPSRPRA
jgi:CRISPR-associated protein Cas6